MVKMLISQINLEIICAYYNSIAYGVFCVYSLEIGAVRGLKKQKIFLEATAQNQSLS
jgi:hypothetical protein